MARSRGKREYDYPTEDELDEIAERIESSYGDFADNLSDKDNLPDFMQYVRGNDPSNRLRNLLNAKEADDYFAILQDNLVLNKVRNFFDREDNMVSAGLVKSQSDIPSLFKHSSVKKPAWARDKPAGVGWAALSENRDRFAGRLVFDVSDDRIRELSSEFGVKIGVTADIARSVAVTGMGNFRLVDGFDTVEKSVRTYQGFIRDGMRERSELRDSRAESVRLGESVSSIDSDLALVERNLRASREGLRRAVNSLVDRSDKIAGVASKFVVF